MAEMTASEYLMEKAKMTKNCTVGCRKCFLFEDNNNVGCFCADLEYEYPAKAIAIMQKWAREHPRKAFLQDFLEKHPKAKLAGDGTPCGVFPCDLGYVNESEFDNDCNHRCVECWNRPLEVEE